MNYGVYICNNKLCVTHNGISVLENITINSNFVGRENVEFIPSEINTNNGCIEVDFVRKTKKGWMPETESTKLIIKEVEDSAIVYFNQIANNKTGCYDYSYRANGSVNINFTLPKEHDEMFSTKLINPYWINPVFENNMENLGEKPHLISYHSTAGHTNLLPAVNREIRTNFSKNGLVINIGVANKYEINSHVLSICTEDEPQLAIHNNMVSLKNAGLLNVKLYNDRKYPTILEGFGWCTWNAYYREVTEEKLIEKLEEFRKKKIQLKWLIIDDGWASYNENRELDDFEEDFNKFPKGLKHFSDIAKNEYGVKYIGVWHAFTGHWKGISKNGKIYKEHKDYLFESPCGMLLPGETAEKAYLFWNTWHSYLKAQGVDFVKVDNQTAFNSQFGNVYPGSTGLYNAYEGLEKSVFNNFDGTIINCMGSDYENMLCRPDSSISRNSDDFYPNKDGSFATHIIQNAYSAVVHNEIHCCDYDMFWTNHESATVNAVLRAISGGPVYTSDQNGQTNAEELMPLMSKAGDVYRFDYAARVTKDLFYTDCISTKTPIKVYNSKGNNLVVAAFGLSKNEKFEGVFKLSDLPRCGEKYLVHDYFKDEYFVMDESTEINISLLLNECRLFSLYPIIDGKVSIGDKALYAEAAAPACAEKDISEFVK